MSTEHGRFEQIALDKPFSASCFDLCSVDARLVFICYNHVTHDIGLHTRNYNKIADGRSM